LTLPIFDNYRYFAYFFEKNISSSLATASSSSSASLLASLSASSSSSSSQAAATSSSSSSLKSSSKTSSSSSNSSSSFQAAAAEPIPPPKLGGHISNTNFAHLKGRSKTGLAVGDVVRLKYVDERPGSKEKMRDKIFEALVANYTASSMENGTIKGLQIHLKVRRMIY